MHRRSFLQQLARPLIAWDELFVQKEGMAAGIDFDHYDDIQVEVGGQHAESIHIVERFDELGIIS